MTVLEKSIEIAAPIETVWRYLEDPDLLAGWLMRNSYKPERGAKFSFFAKPGGDWDGEIRSEVVEFNPPHKLAFTWNANNIGTDTLVTIELTAADNGTQLSLRHVNWEGAKGDMAVHMKTHGEGWSDHLGLLGRAAETEVDDGQSPAIEWTRFRNWLVIEATPDRVFRAWATSGGMESFFVEAMQFRSVDGSLRGTDDIAKQGDTYAWRWDSGRASAGSVLAVANGRTITYTFGDCKFRIEVHPYKGGTLLELEQFDMANDEETRMHVHTNCRTAWAYFMTNLKAVLEHGIDVRDKSRVTGASFSTWFSPEAAGIHLPDVA